MNRHRSLLLAPVLMVLAWSVPAAAQLNRSFVSIGGSDVNPCTIASPCRTFAAALAQTNPDGEVLALDSGGFGALIITDPVTVMGAPGAHVAVATISSFAIDIGAAVAGPVVLRNLFVTGTGINAAALNSTSVNAHVTLENSTLHNHGNGIWLSGGRLTMVGSTISRCTNGLTADDADGWAAAVLDRVEIAGSGNLAILSHRNAVVVIRDSVVSGGRYGLTVGDGGRLFAENIQLNGFVESGIQSQTSGVLYLSNSVITDNVRGVSITATGTVYAFGNNRIAGNGTDIAGTITPAAAQ